MADQHSDVDEFEEIMQGGGFGDTDLVDASGIITAEAADDHTVLHMVEALAQVASYLDAERFVIERASDDTDDLAYMLTVGTGTFFAEVTEAIGGSVKLGDPNDIEFVAWLRRTGGAMAEALAEYLSIKGIPVFYAPVWLSGHGFFPFSVHARHGMLADTSWQVTRES